MTISVRRRAITAAFSGTALLGLSLGLSGCGGGESDTSPAVVYTDPGANVPSATTPAAGGAASPTPSATTGTGSAAATPAPAAAVKAEGWGTLKGQIVFGGAPPAPENTRS